MLCPTEVGANFISSSRYSLQLLPIYLILDLSYFLSFSLSGTLICIFEFVAPEGVTVRNQLLGSSFILDLILCCAHLCLILFSNLSLLALITPSLTATCCCLYVSGLEIMEGLKYWFFEFSAELHIEFSMNSIPLLQRWV